MKGPRGRGANGVFVHLLLLCLRQHSRFGATQDCCCWGGDLTGHVIHEKCFAIFRNREREMRVMRHIYSCTSGQLTSNF